MHQNQTKSPKTQLWIILAIVFFGFLGLSIPYLIFPSLFLNPSYTILPAEWSEASRGLFLGITLAAFPFGQFLGSPIFGTLSDNFGRRKIMSISLLIAAFCSLLTALSLEYKSIWLLITSRFLAGLMEGNLAIARAMAANIKQLNKHNTFGKINAAISTAYILGPLIVALLSDRAVHKSLTPSTPFFIICSLFLALSVVASIAITEYPKSTQTPKHSFWQQINFTSRLNRLFKNRQLKSLLLLVSLHALAVDMFFEFGPAYLTTK